MLYSICPKCQFRIVNGRQTCSTCGHVLNIKRVSGQGVVVSDGSQVAASAAPQAKSFWKSLLGIEKPGGVEKAHDEPALGEG